MPCTQSDSPDVVMFRCVLILQYQCQSSISLHALRPLEGDADEKSEKVWNLECGNKSYFGGDIRPLLCRGSNIRGGLSGVLQR